MATNWKPPMFSGRPVRGTSSAPAPAAPGESAAAGGPKPPAAARRGPLPSLAELGAFDGVSAAPAPRRPHRLTEEDLRGLGKPSTDRTRAATAKPEEPLARPKAGRSWHADTPFETVQTPEGVLLKREAEARAQAQAQERVQTPEPGAPGEGAGPPSAPVAPSAAPRKSVPAVQVAWTDLNAAVQAGWIRPEAAHALWARWLARKPLTHVEDDGESVAVLPPLPPASAPSQDSAPEAASPRDTPVLEPAGTASPPPAHGAPAFPPGGPADRGAQGPEPQPAAQRHDPGPPSPEVLEEAEPPGGARREPEAPSAAEHRQAPPEVVDVEVLEPLEEAHARRAAERAAQPPPVIQVTDVIEALPEASPPSPSEAPGWVLGQSLIALLAAALTAVSVGLGHVLFGPGGAALAALFWTVVVWRKTSAFMSSGQTFRAVLGAHLVLPLLALTVWQVQELAGWWPAARPLDLFADAPLESLARAAPGLQLDWRWLALAGIPLVAAVIWLIRLRRPVLLGAVTALLWVVTFQAVAGVLQALGLAFHGMTVFMLLLGGLTLLGAFYIDLKSRAAGVADFARWPYLCGAVLLGAGWLSLSVVPGPLVVLRYGAWLVFIAWALSLPRPSLVALALAMAGFEASFSLSSHLGSELVGGVAWLVWLAATGAVLAWMLPRAARWAPRWRFWMPQGWQQALSPPPGVRAEG